MNKTRLIVSALLPLFLVACASSKIISLPASGKLAHVVKSIAVEPEGKLLADAVAVQLGGRGFTIIDHATTARLMARLNLNEIDLTRAEGLAKLRGQGIDALLSVRAMGGYDNQPENATATFTSTHTGGLITAITWQNARAGQSGSLADRNVRKGLIEAASEIAEALAKRIQ